MTKKRIGLVSILPKYVGGMTTFMQVLEKELKARGYHVESVYPAPSVLRSVPLLGYALSYGLLREKLQEFDLIIGSGIGLTGGIDLDKPIIDTVHACSVAADSTLRIAYKNCTDEERAQLDELLGAILECDTTDIPRALSVKSATFEVDKQIAQSADRVVTVAPGIARKLIKLFNLNPDQVSWVYNGIENYWSETRTIDSFIDSVPVNVVYSGRGGANTTDLFLKGLDRALLVFKRMRKARPLCLIHVTNDEKRERYQRFLAKKKIPAYFNLPHTELPHYLREGDIYIHTSRSESFGLSLAEAMASGLAPISYPVGFVPEIIKDGVNGFVVRSVKEMQERVAQLIKDPALRQRMGEAARRTVQENFSVDRMVNCYTETIETLLPA